MTGIEGVEGGYAYSVSLNVGLNNLLVPRGAFLSSPLGQALIYNTNESVALLGREELVLLPAPPPCSRSR